MVLAWWNSPLWCHGLGPHLSKTRLALRRVRVSLEAVASSVRTPLHHWPWFYSSVIPQDPGSSEHQLLKEGNFLVSFPLVSLCF